MTTLDKILSYSKIDDIDIVELVDWINESDRFSMVDNMNQSKPISMQQAIKAYCLEKGLKQIIKDSQLAKMAKTTHLKTKQQYNNAINDLYTDIYVLLSMYGE